MEREVQKYSRIPEDVLFNVLEFLPAKSLMRFKCVSKAWHDQICDPSFAESHRTRSYSRPNASYIIFYMGSRHFYQIQALIPTNLEAVFSSEISLPTFQKYVPCTSVVHGLICLLDPSNGELEMLNITTGEKISLPQIRSGVLNRNDSISLTIGFDPVTKEYKLVSFLLNNPQPHVLTNAHIKIWSCEILTLGTQSWRFVSCPSSSSSIGFAFDSKTVCVNGGIYWLDRMMIRYFDVKEEKFGELFLPEGATDTVQLTQVGGTLALICRREENCHCEEFELWKLINTDNNMHYAKYQIIVPGNQKYMRLLEFFGSTQRDEIFMSINQEKLKENLEVIVYNVESGKFRTIKLTCPPCQPATIGNLFSLVSGIFVGDHVENIVSLRALTEQNMFSRIVSLRWKWEGQGEINRINLYGRLFPRISTFPYGELD